MKLNRRKTGLILVCLGAFCAISAFIVTPESGWNPFVDRLAWENTEVQLRSRLAQGEFLCTATGLPSIARTAGAARKVSNWCNLFSRTLRTTNARVVSQLAVTYKKDIEPLIHAAELLGHRLTFLARLKQYECEMMPVLEKSRSIYLGSAFSFLLLALLLGACGTVLIAHRSG